MTTDNPKNILELCTKGGIALILLYIIVHFGTLYYDGIQEMNKQLLSIRVELAKIQSTLMSKDDISSMIDDKINLHQAKYHK